MNRFLRTAALALVLCGLAAPAFAEGIFSRIRESGRALASRGNATVGTVMAMQPVEGDSQQTAILVLDTVIQMGLGCYIVPADDRARLHRKVEIGSTFEAVSVMAGSVSVGELECYIVSRWKAQKRGNAARREFLTGGSGFLGPVMAYALRGRPEALAHFYPNGAPQLAGVVTELPSIIETLGEVGFDVSAMTPGRAPEPAPLAASAEPIEVESLLQPAFDHDSTLLSCRAALRTSRDALSGFADVMQRIRTSAFGAGHHDELDAARTGADAIGAIDHYFAAHPLTGGAR